MTQTGNGYTMMERVAEACGEYAVVEKKPNLDGRYMTMFLAPKKDEKTEKPSGANKA